MKVENKKQLKCKNRECVWNMEDGECINKNILERYKEARMMITCISFVKAQLSREYLRNALRVGKDPFELFNIVSQMMTQMDRLENERNYYQAIYSQSEENNASK